MKIVSWNTNDLLACMEKGGFTLIANLQPGIVCCRFSPLVAENERANIRKRQAQDIAAAKARV